MCHMLRLLTFCAFATLLGAGWANAAPIEQTLQAPVEQRPGCFNRCAAKQICRRCNGGGRCCTNCCRSAINADGKIAMGPHERQAP